MRPIAAFDFDGTITRRDTLLPYLIRLVGRPKLIGAAAVDLPRLALAAAGRSDRDAAKARLFARVLRDQPVDAVHDVGAEHAREVLAHEVRPHMRERLEWHRREGHEIVIVSASLDPYLDVIGPELGVDRVVCTRLETRDGRLTGVMLGGNCRGAAKVTRLEAEVGPVAGRELWAYGDSAGDRELLAAADHAFWVAKDGTLTTRGASRDPAS